MALSSWILHEIFGHVPADLQAWGARRVVSGAFGQGRWSFLWFYSSLHDSGWPCASGNPVLSSALLGQQQPLSLLPLRLSAAQCPCLVLGMEGLLAWLPPSLEEAMPAASTCSLEVSMWSWCLGPSITWRWLKWSKESWTGFVPTRPSPPKGGRHHSPSIQDQLEKGGVMALN